MALDDGTGRPVCGECYRPMTLAGEVEEFSVEVFVCKYCF